MLADRDLAVHAAGTYAYADQPEIAWDHWQADSEARPVCVGAKYVGGATIIAVRGSVTGFDWAFNFDALPTDAGPLGYIDAGFYAGIPETAAWLAPLVKGRVFVTGHSRGGGQTPLLVAELKKLGIKVQRYACFGPPRCGMAELAAYLSDIPGRLYRARSGIWHDIVTDVPEPLPRMPYEHVRPLIDLPVKITPTAVKDMGLAAIHYAPGYAAAL